MREKFLQKIWQKNLIGLIARFWAKFSWLKLGEIPDEQIIWRAVYNSHQIKPNGELKSSFFKGADLSCDAAILTDPDSARFGHHEPQRPATTGLVQFTVKDVKEASGAGVYHDPLVTNLKRKHYSHCQFRANLTQGQANKMKVVAKMFIKPTFKVEDPN